jgi:hypothetical protein
MGQTSRVAALAIAGSAVVALAGCASSGGTAASGSATVSASPATQWASSVCSSAQTLEQSLQHLTDRLTISIGGPQSSLSQAKQQLLKRLGDVGAAASGVTAALQAPPASADQPVKAAQQQLTTASSRSQQAVQRVTSVAAQLQTASTPAELTKDAVALGGATAAAATAAGSFLTSIKQYASSTQTSIRNAFGNAPSCQALLSSG